MILGILLLNDIKMKFHLVYIENQFYRAQFFRAQDNGLWRDLNGNSETSVRLPTKKKGFVDPSLDLTLVVPIRDTSYGLMGKLKLSLIYY